MWYQIGLIVGSAILFTVLIMNDRKSRNKAKHNDFTYKPNPDERVSGSLINSNWRNQAEITDKTFNN